MFQKILIANRGEIACRVIRTAHRMGIRTVAVYSEADAGALHVELADEAVEIGPAISAESYLVIDRILQACKRTGADAVHPGYGFLSENAGFARALAGAGITFIGPPVAAIESMGDKIASKLIAEKAGVNTIPGYTGTLRDEQHAVEVANEIGYPVMLKASAGGGGKGMRIAHDDTQCREGFLRATNEAKSSFGDDRVFLERYIQEPRHIEIQILGDTHGNLVYLGERECSIQRRHQKVIEEAPSPLLDEETRAHMGAQALALAAAVDYYSAGTVEFVSDPQRNFYFLEMNTRLQVEHPITEMVTGLDLVEQMLRVAAGERLQIKQDDIKLNGWAIEARIYAEDPTRGFLPSTGRLIRYQTPDPEQCALDEIRVDTGVAEGDEVSMFYDPMIAKLVAHGSTRKMAIDRACRALDSTLIRGLAHNTGFLTAVLSHPRFASGALTTNFLAEEFPTDFHPTVLDDPAAVRFALLAAAVHQRMVDRDRQLGSAPGLQGAAPSAVPGFSGSETVQWVVKLDERYLDVELTHICYQAGAVWTVTATCAGHCYALKINWQPAKVMLRADLGHEQVIVQVERDGIGYLLNGAGFQSKALVLRRAAASMERAMPFKAPPDLSKFLLSPMPGLLVKLSVAEGQSVKTGEEIAVVEAMKMENVLRSAQDVRVKSILVEQGESLQVDQPIVEFE